MVTVTSRHKLRREGRDWVQQRPDPRAATSGPPKPESTEVPAGLWYASRDAARHGIEARTFEAAAWWLGIAGVLGARTLYVVQWGLGPTADPLHFLMLWEGGLSFYGGLVGGVIALAVFAGRRGLPLALLADVAAAAAALGMSAVLASRSPPRLRRCLVVLPEEAGIGSTPQGWAKAASERRRPTFWPALTRS